MEVCVPHKTSDHGSSTGPLSPTHYDSGDLSVNDLKACLTDFLVNKDLVISTSDVKVFPGKYDICNLKKEDEPKKDKSKSSNSTSEQCFGKCVTFPPTGEPKSPVDGFLVGDEKQDIDKIAEVSEVNGYTESGSHCYSQSVSLTTPLKLVSAMKGSRGKPKKLSVTWASDVYDPIPTSVSHFLLNKNHRHHNNSKKYGKNKQKCSGKSSRGSKGKAKKQPKKNTVSSTKNLKNLHDDVGNRIIGFNEPQMGLLDFNVNTSDPFCRSSFLKKSVATLHFPVAEAK